MHKITLYEYFLAGDVKITCTWNYINYSDIDTIHKYFYNEIPELVLSKLLVDLDYRSLAELAELIDSAFRCKTIIEYANSKIEFLGYDMEEI